MSSEKWFAATMGCLLAPLIPIGIADSLTASGAVIPLVVVAVPILLLLSVAGWCARKTSKAIDGEWGLTRKRPTLGRSAYPLPSREWMPDYNRDWYQTHLTTDPDLKGHWERGGQTRRDYWVTGTPEWDGPWFYERGYRMPRHWRMRGAVESTWIDFGDGLSLRGVKE